MIAAALRWLIGTRAGVAVAVGGLLLAVTVPTILITRADLADARDQVTELRTDLQVVTQNRERLRQKLEEQTAAVRDLEAAAEQVSESAIQAARDVLDTAPAQRERDDAVSAAPEEMNEWLHDLFVP